MVRQIILDGWEPLIDPNFDTKSVCAGADQDLFSIQAVFMSTVLDKVILNIYGIKLAQLYNNSPRVIWEKHEEHQTSSSSSQQIAMVLSNKLSNIKIASSKSRIVFLEEFDKSVIKFDKVSADKMPESQKIRLL